MRIKTTQYFRRRVLITRPYIRMEWCIQAVQSAEFRQVQPDGRIRHWIYVPELERYLRVVTLEDGVTIHNAFLDRGFTPDQQ